MKSSVVTKLKCLRHGGNTCCSKHSNTTTPKIRTPQLLGGNIFKAAQDTAGYKYQFWCCLSSAISSRSLLGEKQKNPEAKHAGVSTSHLLTNSGCVSLQHGEFFSCSCIPDLYKALVSANSYQGPLDKQKTMISKASKHRQM